MLVYQKTMFDHYCCIKSFCCLKTLENRLEKFIFVFTYNGGQKRERFIGFKNTCSRAKTSVVTKLCSLLCTLLLMMSIFVTYT